MAMIAVTSSLPPRLRHFTPLRYPGGKARLAGFVKELIRSNSLLDGEYVEPYAGGAAIAIELLLHEYVSHIHINDVSRPIHAFWSSVLNHTDELAQKVTDARLTVSEWDKQKKILVSPEDHDDLTVGFATFFLNRTNRSGVLNAGIIGGRDQTGPWKIDARFNAKELVGRIITIARMRSRISLTRKDALKFLGAGAKKWPSRTLVYLDPPYYVKGRQLYYDFYEPDDHAHVAEFVMQGGLKQRWIVSYDNVREVRKLYRGVRHVVYDIGYSVRSARKGSEVMFFSEGLKVPSSLGNVRV